MARCGVFGSSFISYFNIDRRNSSKGGSGAESGSEHVDYLVENDESEFLTGLPEDTTSFVEKFK